MLAYNLGVKWIFQVAETLGEVEWFENIQTDKNCVASKLLMLHEMVDGTKF